MKIRYALIILVLILVSANYSGAAEILNVRYWAAPDHTRVVIDLGSEPSFEIRESENLLALSFQEATFRRSLPAVISIDKPGIRKVTLNAQDKGVVQIDFILDKYLKTEVFKLKKFQDKPDRVVVDIFFKRGTSAEEIIKTQPSRIKEGKIIVIDPGHGGEDPGAVGKNGTYEKNIVLSISREMKKAINKITGYRAVLTRDGDYYVSFKKRLQTAKDLNASLFISVHADAARNRQAKGSSIYCLSTGAASNEAAKLLAKNENLSDIIGGVPNGEGKNDSDQIILNMFQTNTINVSKTYAGNLLQQMDKINHLKYKNVQEAPFRVLKLPDIPAVLIETAYISNIQEEQLLKNRNFQKKLARTVASSVTEYLSGTTFLSQGNDALRGKDLAVNSNGRRLPEKVDVPNEPETISYKVKRGDTLFSIAALFNTKVAVLLKMNNSKMEEPLLAGRKILVPLNKPVQSVKRDGDTADIPGKSNQPKVMSGTYKVKKGDTLYSLAKSKSITITELRKINHLQDKDTLLVGQRIKLP
jgi:N-acetylmuramoyl-L-alanine amidase